MHEDGWLDTLEDEPDAWNDSLGWRRRLAKWPDEWRERWGIRANELEESGVDWIEAERQAWNETYPLRQQGEPGKTDTPPPRAAGRAKTTAGTLFRESA